MAFIIAMLMTGALERTLLKCVRAGIGMLCFFEGVLDPKKPPAAALAAENGDPPAQRHWLALTRCS